MTELSVPASTVSMMSPIIEWLSRQPSWTWLLAVAFITHRLTLRREKWNREQSRRNDQRRAVADFSATVNAVGPDAANLSTWLQRRKTAETPSDFDEANTKVDELLSAFAERVFEVHRVADLLRMTLVDPELNYRASFVLKLAQDFTEMGGDRRLDPSADSFSLALLEHRCTARLKELMGATDNLVKAAIARVPPQTTWLQRRMASAYLRSKIAEVEAFASSVDTDTAQTFEATVGDIDRTIFTTTQNAGTAHAQGTPPAERPPGVRERVEKAEDGSEVHVRITRVLADDVDQSFLGKRIGKYRGGYNRLGTVVDLSRTSSQPSPRLRITVDWRTAQNGSPEYEIFEVDVNEGIDFVEVV